MIKTQSMLHVSPVQCFVPSCGSWLHPGVKVALHQMKRGVITVRSSSQDGF